MTDEAGEEGSGEVGETGRVTGGVIRRGVRCRRGGCWKKMVESREWKGAGERENTTGPMSLHTVVRQMRGQTVSGPLALFFALLLFSQASSIAPGMAALAGQSVHHCGPD